MSAAPVLASTGTFLTYATRTNSLLPVPASVAAGEVLVAYLYVDTTSVTVTPPTGFTALTFSPAFTLASPYMECHVYWKWATAADTGTYTFSHSSTATQGVVERYTGCTLSGTPVEVLGCAVNATASTTSPAITGTTRFNNETLALSCFIFTGVTWTTLSGWTDAQNGAGQYNAVKAQATAGTTGSISATAGGSNSHIAALIAMIPATPVPRPVNRARSIRAANF